MGNTLIGIIGEDNDCEEILFKCFKNFYPNNIVLITKEKYIKKSNKILKKLEEFEIKVEIIKISNFPHIEEVFKTIKTITNAYTKDSIVINVDVDYMTSCLALSSAFVNGIAALGVLGKEIIAYPIMKFSYYNAINDKKMQILKILNTNKIDSMEQLSKLSKMSLPLIAYHLRGNKDSKGLIEMELVKTTKINSTVKVKLTELGKLIVNGDIDCSTNLKLRK